MSIALLLVDLQYDFLERPGLLPSQRDLSSAIATVLEHARTRGIPVLHIRTRIDPAGHDRMPHWKAAGIWACVTGTRGVETPPEFSALGDEAVIYKPFFSGFGNPQLEQTLAESGVEELWIVGLYTHSCVRATAMDAYERGFRVTLIEDCLGSTDTLHAHLTREYMDGRSAVLKQSGELLQLHPEPMVHYCPTRQSLAVAVVPYTSKSAIRQITAGARRAAIAWRRTSLASRRDVMRKFAKRLDAAAEQLLTAMITDLGKPRGAALDELQRAAGHIQQALALENNESIDPSTGVVYEPHGVVAIVTPWNNPVAIAVGKLSAALILGNGVVWKPAFQAHNISQMVLELLQGAGLPEDLVQIVNGGPTEVAWLAQDPDIAAVSVTGPEQAGRTIAPICQSSGKVLQAELGGNNALLVLADADLSRLAPVWARLAFGFAGQRCTAIRRFVVERTIAGKFEDLMLDAIRTLHLMHPELDTCDVGPVISLRHLERIDSAVQSAVARGARLITGGSAWECAEDACYYLPTLLADLEHDDAMVQEELFAPVAVMQLADDFEHGLALVNGVRQGLLAGIASRSASRYQEFVQQCDVGIIIDGDGLQLHPAAPFGGRKASQQGSPEHGIWDREFFSRAKACYRSAGT